MTASVVAVIDDNKAWIDTVTEVLSDEGFDVRCATSGEDAIELLDSVRPDLIILDVHILPRSSGLQILTDFRGRDRSTPVLVVSGDDRALIRHQAMSDGASAFLQKPVSSSELLRAVKRYIDKTRTPAGQGEYPSAPSDVHDPSLN